ncbi:uncharacterized protein ACA1_183580 [Acanthamoeba castellanii str. Neff]|uniref:Uncharacterized protein n=1 Tax=Acanthamoeba castellanii (strain ATCC 30010 / Neff) TaxID=1257118 RepID=L8H851_ACACF|nr:uncharacterized protein ACA1_183580 [Acanthamoeba castellanii str. Neff]ELR21422.1 hypothetical protein ACA1_183580 [Acanthamoeba castellanii str. Neff]
MEVVPSPSPTVLEDPPLVPQAEAKVANIDEVVDIWDDCHLYEHRLLTYRSSLPRHALTPLADQQSQEDDENREVAEASKIDPTSSTSATGGDDHQELQPAREDVGELLTIELYQHQTSFRALNTVGLTVWKSSVALARFLEELWRQEGPSFLVGKRVIELGSGCGLTGILATLLGGHTTFTDMESVLLWTNRNVEHNLDPFKHTYRLKELHWGRTELAAFQPGFDIVLGADLIYSPKVVMALLNTLHGVSRPDSRVLVAFENHNPTATKLFLAHLPRYFDTVLRKDDIESVEGDAFQNFLHDYSDDTDSDYDSD